MRRFGTHGWRVRGHRSLDLEIGLLHGRLLSYGENRLSFPRRLHSNYLTLIDLVRIVCNHRIIIALFMYLHRHFEVLIYLSFSFATLGIALQSDLDVLALQIVMRCIFTRSTWAYQASRHAQAEDELATWPEIRLCWSTIFVAVCSRRMLMLSRLIAMAIHGETAIIKAFAHSDRHLLHVSFDEAIFAKAHGQHALVFVL